MATTNAALNVYNINKGAGEGEGSKLTYLTSGAGAGKIKFMGAATTPINAAAVAKAAEVTGIVIPLQGASLNGLGETDFSAPLPMNIIGDPTELNYSLTSGDLFDNAGNEVNGGAQKFVNAVLDGAYRGYQSGVDQGSGLNSMTVSRGALSLSNTAVTDGTGIVNTWTRSYTVNFKYYQSGVIQGGDDDTASRPDIANDLSDGVPF